MDTGAYLLTVPQQYMSALLQATGAQKDQYGEVCLVELSPSLGEPSSEALIGFSWEHRNSWILGLPISRCSRHWRWEARG